MNTTKGELLAATFRPFLSPGIKKLSDVDPTVSAMAKAIDNAFEPEMDLLRELVALGIRAEHSPHQINSIITRAKSIL